MVAAARHGLVPSLWVSDAARCSSFNFFFLPPLYQFTIADPANVLALFLFMFVAVAASALGTRTRAQAEAARREARTTAELYAFSRKIAGVIDLDDLLWIVVTQLARLLDAEVAILMPEKAPAETGKLVLRAAFPPDSEFSEADLAAARWSWDAERPTGRGTDTLPGGRWLFMPIRTSRSSIGVIGVLSKARPACRRRRAACSRRSATRPPSRSSAWRWRPTSTRRGCARSASGCARPC